MAIQSFRVTLSGVDFTAAGGDADRVLAVCDDVILSHEPEGDLAVFDREAGTFAAAVGGALADLERALPAARVLRVEAVPSPGSFPSPRPGESGGLPARQAGGDVHGHG